MKPRRLQLSRKAGWRKPDGAVVCSRPGRWGNPFIIDPKRSTSSGKAVGVWREEEHGNGFFGRTLVAGYDTTAEAASCAVGYFAAWLMSSGPFEAVRLELRGKDLCCWCRLCPAHAAGKPWDVECKDCAPCHADVLLRAANLDRPAPSGDSGR